MTRAAFAIILASTLCVSCSDRDYDICTTPTFVADCEHGWCKVPKGCQVVGEPPPGTTPCFSSMAGANAKRHRLWISHAFTIQQKEIQEPLARAFGIEPLKPKQPCFEGYCPAKLDWHQAAALCNAFSRHEGRQLCYRCEQTTGAWRCERASGSSFFQCGGYRLPSRGEWEYALFAGQESPLFGHVDPRSKCEASLVHSIAWVMSNSRATPHRGGLKAPNPLGLYDMLGNYREWLDDDVHPLVDPVDYRPASTKEKHERLAKHRALYDQDQRDPHLRREGSTHMVHGGHFDDQCWSLSMTIPTLSNDHVGARCVRTLADDD